MAGFDVAATASSWSRACRCSARAKRRTSASMRRRTTPTASSCWSSPAIVMAVLADRDRGRSGRPQSAAVHQGADHRHAGARLAVQQHGLRAALRASRLHASERRVLGLRVSAARPHPVYWDFVYFAFTCGMAFATSDVAITETHIRKIVTIHCLAAFAFNIGVLAFTHQRAGVELGGDVDLRRRRPLCRAPRSGSRRRSERRPASV